MSTMQSDGTGTPADWDTTYNIAITGKTLEAMRFLADHHLRSGMQCTSLATIGACDHLLSFVVEVRAGQSADFCARPEQPRY